MNVLLHPSCWHFGFLANWSSLIQQIVTLVLLACAPRGFKDFLGMTYGGRVFHGWIPWMRWVWGLSMGFYSVALLLFLLAWRGP